MLPGRSRSGRRVPGSRDGVTEKLSRFLSAILGGRPESRVTWSFTESIKKGREEEAARGGEAYFGLISPSWEQKDQSCFGDAAPLAMVLGPFWLDKTEPV